MLMYVCITPEDLSSKQAGYTRRVSVAGGRVEYEGNVHVERKERGVPGK